MFLKYFKGDVEEQLNSLTMMDDDKQILTMEEEVVFAENILTVQNITYL